MIPAHALRRGVHVWLIDLDGDAAADPAHWLSADERARAGRFVHAHDRRWYERSHAVLRALLARHAGRTADRIRYVVDASGKPHLAGTPLHFSLSHGHACAAVAICEEHAVGIDIETVRPIEGIVDLARECLAPDEWAAFDALAAEERTCAFLVAWTRKEAVLKAIGTGLLVAPATVATGITAAPARIVVDRQALQVSTISAKRCVASVAALGGAGADVRWASMRWSDALSRTKSSAPDDTTAATI